MRWHTKYLARCFRIRKGDDGIGDNNNFCCCNCYNISFKVECKCQETKCSVYFLTLDSLVSLILIC